MISQNIADAYKKLLWKLHLKAVKYADKPVNVKYSTMPFSLGSSIALLGHVYIRNNMQPVICTIWSALGFNGPGLLRGAPATDVAF